LQRDASCGLGQAMASEKLCQPLLTDTSPSVQGLELAVQYT